MVPSMACKGLRRPFRPGTWTSSPLKVPSKASWEARRKAALSAAQVLGVDTTWDTEPPAKKARSAVPTPQQPPVTAGDIQQPAEPDALPEESQKGCSGLSALPKEHTASECHTAPTQQEAPSVLAVSAVQQPCLRVENLLVRHERLGLVPPPSSRMGALLQPPPELKASCMACMLILAHATE
ncbi:hypothetical protein COCSUDRAFT_62194 [Coccomyxa subellipsoidea C-169]|uniref:Uncharacterized protein n=1 Tax=Coccomyxa subellipsoidea (strain C-169) TaxID=574566 RepID=I0Z2B5_COCSC|nr:hypothetical protein COCSUDRAFT_62194 [Coccomyxa subellipsoidea C-169]EIE24784.1 hypothetical protein COCSUDRAFT_62194 [Coccomyxa subellipsoidea C-169]|eukprot:XP_005649328.1 hypothetical protein COCSUDRAFT_62194 [Coccomyxa subellipsoidea C-169]